MRLVMPSKPLKSLLNQTSRLHRGFWMQSSVGSCGKPVLRQQMLVEPFPSVPADLASHVVLPLDLPFPQASLLGFQIGSVRPDVPVLRPGHMGRQPFHANATKAAHRTMAVYPTLNFIARAAQHLGEPCSLDAVDFNHGPTDRARLLHHPEFLGLARLPSVEARSPRSL
jgi:hypothetical protein